MPIQSLNWNDKIKSLADGDNLSRPQKKSLMDQYNSNIPSIQNQLGYLPSYGPTTNPSRSAVQVINSAYDTSGNGSRKVVRLNNGTIMKVVKVSGVGFKMYKYDLTTFTEVWGAGVSITPIDIAIATNGTNVYGMYTYTNGGTILATYFVTDKNGTQIFGNTLDSSQTAVGNCSLTYSPTDNKLKGVWASKNATLPNSFNIRYAEGTINGDGSVTWGSVEQWSSANTSGYDYTSPTIVINSIGFPVVTCAYANTVNRIIQCFYKNGSGVQQSTVYLSSGTTYTQSSPSATVDGNGHIQVVWKGYDATDTTRWNIRYSKSTDGGVTWSAMLKLTSGNTYDQDFPSITYDQSNNLCVYFMGITASSSGKQNIRSITYTGSWGSVVEVTNQSTAHMMYPSLCDNVRTFTSPLVIWQDNVSPSVKFSGTWTDTPLLSETTSTSAVSNKALIDAFISSNFPSFKNNKKWASGSTTSNGSGVITVSGLSFQPSYILIDNATVAKRTTFNKDYNTTLNGYEYTTASSTNIGLITTNASGFTSPGHVTFTAHQWIAFE